MKRELIINPCICRVCGKPNAYRGYAKISFNEQRKALSITGVIGPSHSGNCAGSAGQCVDEIRAGEPQEGWTRELLDTFCDIWERWHMNDIKSVCPHQRGLGLLEKANLGKPCPVCGWEYGSGWYKEDVPDEVLDFLFHLPAATHAPAWI